MGFSVSDKSSIEQFVYNQLDKSVDMSSPIVKDTQISYRDIALTIGGALNEAEKNALEAFSLPDAATADQKAQIGKSLGMTDDKAKGATVTGLQQAASLILQKMRNLMEMFSNLMASKKRTDDGIVQNMRG